jgi:hypothetical protein
MTETHHLGNAAGINTGEIDDAGPFRQARDERSRLARHLALPQHHAVASCKPARQEMRDTDRSAGLRTPS